MSFINPSSVVTGQYALYICSVDGNEKASKLFNTSTKNGKRPASKRKRKRPRKMLPAKTLINNLVSVTGFVYNLNNIQVEWPCLPVLMVQPADHLWLFFFAPRIHTPSYESIDPLAQCSTNGVSGAVHSSWNKVVK
jgi:hypothetical protein